MKVLIPREGDANFDLLDFDKEEDRKKFLSFFPYLPSQVKALGAASTVPFFISPEGKILVALVHNVLKDGDSKIYRLPEGYFNPLKSDIPDKDLQDTAEHELLEKVMGKAKRIFKICSEMNVALATFIETYGIEIADMASLQANGIEISKMTWIDPNAFEFKADDSAEKFSVYIGDDKISYPYVLRIAKLMQMIYNEQIQRDSMINKVSLFDNRKNALASLYLRPLVVATMQKNNEIDHNIFKSISEQFSEKTKIVAAQLPGKTDHEKKLDLESLAYLSLEAFNDHKQIKKIIEHHQEIAINLNVTIEIKKDEKEKSLQIISVAKNKSSFYPNNHNPSTPAQEALQSPQNKIRFTFQS